MYPTTNSKLSGGNAGLGVAATYNKVDLTCPKTCELLNNGCYAQKGHANIWSTKSEFLNDSLSKIPFNCNLIRINVTGDILNKDGELDTHLINDVRSNALMRPQAKIWGYTHVEKSNPFSDISNIRFFQSISPVNIDLSITSNVDLINDKIKSAHNNSYLVAITVNKPEDIKKIKLENFSYCPIDYLKWGGKKAKEIKLNCATCRLCIDRPPRNIVFIKT